MRKNLTSYHGSPSLVILDVYSAEAFLKYYLNIFDI
jgi:hypothetical protein